jgi:hypothetical protein
MPWRRSKRERLQSIAFTSLSTGSMQIPVRRPEEMAFCLLNPARLTIIKKSEEIGAARTNRFPSVLIPIYGEI